MATPLEELKTIKSNFDRLAQANPKLKKTRRFTLVYRAIQRGITLASKNRLVQNDYAWILKTTKQYVDSLR